MSTPAPAAECELPKCKVAKRNNTAHLARYNKLLEETTAEKKALEEKYAKELRCKDDKIKHERERVKRIEDGHGPELKGLETKIEDLKKLLLVEKRVANTCRKDHAKINPGGDTLVADLATANRKTARLEKEKEKLEGENALISTRLTSADEKITGLEGELRALKSSNTNDARRLNKEVKEISDESNRLSSRLETSNTDLMLAHKKIEALEGDLENLKIHKVAVLERELAAAKADLKKEEELNDQDKREMDEAHKKEVTGLEKVISDLRIDVDGEKAFAEMAKDEAKEEVDALKKELDDLKTGAISSTREVQTAEAASASYSDPKSQSSCGNGVPTIEVTKFQNYVDKASETSSCAEDDKSSNEIITLRTKLSATENKNKTLQSIIKAYQTKADQRYAETKAYVHAIYTGRMLPGLVYGTKEYDSASLNLIGKKSYIQLHFLGYKNQKVRKLIAAAMPPPPTDGRHRGGKRGTNRPVGELKEQSMPVIKEEPEWVSKLQSDVQEEIVEESDDGEDISTPMQTIAPSGGCKCKVSEALDEEKTAEQIREREEAAKRWQARWNEAKADFDRKLALSNTNSSTDTSLNTPTPPTPSTQTTTPIPNVQNPAPTLPVTPTTPNAPEVASTGAWSIISSILGYMIGC